jgi:ribosomal protein S18 acetylase RimI-like enzyme
MAQEITYFCSMDGIRPEMLGGFFQGWSSPPSPAGHLEILNGSSHVVLAFDSGAGRVVGFINAISDGFFAASIPLLEVLPVYRNKGVGRELVRRMLEQLAGFYSIDLACDPDVQRFYEKLGLARSNGMMLRNRRHQPALSQ